MSRNVIIENFCKQKKVLLVTDNNTDRVAWKKLLNEFGTLPTSFQSANTFEEATNIISNIEINIIFCAYKISNESSEAFFEAYKVKCPDRSQTFFFVFSDQTSKAVASKMASNGVDGLLIKPYNLQILTETITKKLLLKLQLGKKGQQFHQIMEMITSEKFDEAHESIIDFTNKYPQDPNPYYLNGLLCIDRKQIDNAVEKFEEALKYDRTHYHTLNNLFDLYFKKQNYTKAYSAAQVLSENYPVNPEKISDYIKASLATQNYPSIINFCKMAIDLEGQLVNLKGQIAAALALSGKYLAKTADKSNLKMAKSASIKAIELSDHLPKITVTALRSLIQLGEVQIAKKYYEEIPKERLSSELREIEPELIYNDKKVLPSAQAKHIHK